MTDNGRLEFNDEHTEQLHKYTAQQLRFLVNRLVFPDASSTACAISAGYAEACANVRASELNRKPHIREMLTASELSSTSASAFDADDMTIEMLIAWHTGIVHNTQACIKEQQASAIELARLKGYHKVAGEQADQFNMMEELIAHKARMKAQSAEASAQSVA